MKHEKSAVKEKLYPCTFCKSKFKRNEIGKHTKICQEAFEKRRSIKAEKKSAREAVNSLAAKKVKQAEEKSMKEKGKSAAALRASKNIEENYYKRVFECPVCKGSGGLESSNGCSHCGAS